MTDHDNPCRLVLASGSPRRIAMLKQLGLTFEVRPASVDESALPGERPNDHVLRLARSKAEAIVASLAPGRDDRHVVIAADTIVVVDGRILGKPTSRQDAHAMLSSLSGRNHHVMTGYCVLDSAGPSRENVVTTEVVFKHLRPVELAGYLDSGEWTDKAGAYGIQGLASFMISQVRGSYTNVVGMPLSHVIEALWDMEAITKVPNVPSDARS